MHTRNRLLGCLAALATGIVPAMAADHALLFGGGADPTSGQVSIEENVLWLRPLLASRTFASEQLLFGSGSDGEADVVWDASGDEDVEYWRPFRQLTDDWPQAALKYRRNRVPGNAGPATRDTVASALESAIAGLEGGDSLLAVYAGHGSFEPADPSRNALRLWDTTHLEAREFAAMLDRAPSGSTVRYILPQCYAGGFLRSNYLDPANPEANAVKPGRCGFVSVSERVESEGCTTGIDTGDYRDYATYFFAALTGETRTGQPLGRNPDRDGDGQVSLAEAHADTYVHADSTDVPRSTSDDYLERWEPVRVRGQSAVRFGDENPYLPLIRGLARELGLDETGVHRPASLAGAALARRLQLAAELQELEATRTLREADERSLREQLLSSFQSRWPEIDVTSLTLERQPSPGSDSARGWLIAEQDFRALERVQLGLRDLDRQILDTQRRAARYERLQRAQRLAVLHEHFTRLATPG